MHWFESQLATLDQLALAYHNAQQQPEASDIVNISEDIRFKRNEFITAVQKLVDDVIRVEGITACAAYHDGLILAYAGKPSDVDALGAIIQESIGVAKQGTALLSLGEIEQIVIIGASNKVAMLNVGPITCCILSPKTTNLASALS